VIEWGSAVEWTALALSIALGAERAWTWIGRHKYATREEVMAAIEQIKNAHHRVDLVEERLKALPGYDKFNELGAGIGTLQQGQARSGAWQEGINRELARIHETLGRLDNRLSSKESD